MKIFLPPLVYCLLFCTSAGAQKKQDWNNSFLYSFKLAPEIPAYLIDATVLYRGNIIIPAVRRIAGKNQLINSGFSLLKKGDNKAGNIQLPFYADETYFVWMMDGDMLAEMASYPGRYSILLNTADNGIKTKYVLPAVFDFIPDHALNITSLLSFSKSERERVIIKNTTTLSIQGKYPLTEAVRDTTLSFNTQHIPKGILLALPGINKNADTLQHFTIEAAFLYNGRLLMPVALQKNIKIQADNCYGILTDPAGKTCASSGCISGRGSGDCASLRTATNKVQYKVSVQISP